MKYIKNNRSFGCTQDLRGFSLVELIIALTVFAILAAGVFYVVTNSYSNFYGSGDKQALAEYAQEGIEAVRAIRNNSWQDIIDSIGNNGVAKASNGLWTFSGSSDTQGDLTRVVTIANVERDSNGNIVDSGGTDDPSTKKVTVTVSADGIDDYVLYTYLTDWSFKTWEQTDWSGAGDYEFWVDGTMGSSSYSNIGTSTAGELKLSLADAGDAFSWSALADLVPDSSFKNKAWEDFYNYKLSPDGKGLYVIGTTNFGFAKFNISRAQAGIFSPEWKISMPWHAQAVAVHPNENYAYIGKRLYTNGATAVCIADLNQLNVDTANDCKNVTMTGTNVYPMVMLLNQAATRLYMMDNYGYAYVFEVSADGSTLTTKNYGQSLTTAIGTSYALNSAYLDESGANPYMYVVSDDDGGEFMKFGFDGDYLSSTSTYAYEDSSFGSNLNDISFIEQVGGKNRFVLTTEDSTKELIVVEDQGTSLTQLGYYNLATSQVDAQVDHDTDGYAVVAYSNPGYIYAVDISNPASPADGGMSNTTLTRRSNYTTFDQFLYSTSSHGFFVNDHLADNTTALHFIGRGMTRASGGQYSYKRKITLGQNSKVSGGPHTDFPVVVAESQDYLKSAAHGGKVQNN
ncbi:type II secretion system protein, partial [Candidatus Parcubacteria bacterium]